MGANRFWAAQAAALAIAVVLGGCGGGSGVASTPAPTPTPTPASYTKIVDMSGDRTFQTAGVQYSTSTAGFNNGTTQSFGSGVTLAYTASTDSYKLTAPDGTSTTFTPSDVVAPSPSAPNSQHWTRQNASAREDFYLTAPTVNGVALSYTIVGSWQRTTSVPGVSDVRLAVGGVLTIASDMPRTGSASYAVAVGGGAAQNGSFYTLSGNSSGTFSADFASNAVTTSLTLAGTVLPNGTTVTPIGTFNGTGTIGSGGPGFTGTLSGGSTSGIFSGAFFGPQALEMAYDFQLSGGNLSAAGTMTGRKQ